MDMSRGLGNHGVMYCMYPETIFRLFVCSVTYLAFPCSLVSLPLHMIKPDENEIICVKRKEETSSFSPGLSSYTM